MDGLYPIIRRVRRPLGTTERPTAPAAVVVSTMGQTASRGEQVQPRMDTNEHESAEDRSSASDVEGAAKQQLRPTDRIVIGDSLRVIDRRNSEESKQHGGKATKKA